MESSPTSRHILGREGGRVVFRAKGGREGGEEVALRGRGEGA